MIIRGGENIYPVEIEAVLLSHPSVAEVAVVGVADRFWGEVVGAVIRAADEAPPTEAELSEFCRGRLPASQIPARRPVPARVPPRGQGRQGRARCRARRQAGVGGRAGVRARSPGPGGGAPAVSRWLGSAPPRRDRLRPIVLAEPRSPPQASLHSGDMAGPLFD